MDSTSTNFPHKVSIRNDILQTKNHINVFDSFNILRLLEPNSQEFVT